MLSKPKIRLCSFLTGDATLPPSDPVCVCDCPPQSGGGGLFITNRSPVEILPLLNLNISIINSQHRKILKASVPPVCEGKHLYWIIAPRLITVPALASTAQ